MKKKINDVFFSFPIQLLLLHFRNNLLLIFTWIILLLMMTGQVGTLFGLKFLFLTPEYMGKVNMLSYFFLGLAFGGFAMSWNLTTYLLDAYLFPFLASLERPFTKFCLNNAIVPLIFIGIYLGFTIHHQSYYEFRTPLEITQNCLSFLGGVLCLVLFTAVYFYYTNKDILNFLSLSATDEAEISQSMAPGRRVPDIDDIKEGKSTWRVDTYLSINLRPRLVRSVAHYDSKILLSVFKQNHVNALVVQLFSLVVLISLGYLIDNEYFRIPAGASVFILMSIIVSLTGAITYWFHQWRLTFIIIMLAFINFVSKYDVLKHSNKAYGMRYEKQEKATYQYNRLLEITHPDSIRNDMKSTEVILDRWKEKAKQHTIGKPKMLLFCVSGGGMRAAVWTMQVMRHCDSLLNNNLMDHTMLITGASGGLIGASYQRELYLQKQSGYDINLYDDRYIDNLSKDLLNALAFTIVSNDLFLPWSKFEINGQTYHKDRGYIFEKQLNENLAGVFDKTLGDYRVPEEQAIVPMLFVSPAIVNDGRRLLISPQDISYMSIPPAGLRYRDILEIDAIEFRGLFAQQQADQLRFSTAMRMNATYPYILPNVHLPSQPVMEVMDAGFRDNHGIMSATRFIHVFRDWVEEHTSGIVLIRISAMDKIDEIAGNDDSGMIENILNPLGIAGQILKLQDYEHDTSVAFLYDMVGPEHFDMLQFIYRASEDERASMTFHLTPREQKDILRSIYLPENQRSLARLNEIMSDHLVRREE